MHRAALIISTVALVVSLGCGGRENGTNASSGVDASTVTERNPQCPATVPTAGGPCKPILECEYGTDSHHVCTTTAECASSDSVNFKWFLTTPTAACGTNTASCPSSFTALANGSPCPGVNSFCEYPEGLC